MPCTLPAIREIVIHIHLTLVASLGSYQYNTVGSASSINSTRSSIFQYFYALYVAGVDIINITFYWHSVNNIERIRVIDGTNTANSNPCSSTRLT